MAQRNRFFEFVVKDEQVIVQVPKDATFVKQEVGSK
jgi:hypothetical protein